MLTKFRKQFRLILVLRMMVSLLFLFACNDEKSDDNGISTPTTTGGGGTNNISGFSFNIAGATALMAQEDTITEASSSLRNFFGGVVHL